MVMLMLLSSQMYNLLNFETENPDEFYDVGMRNKKFGRVDAMNGPRILEKYVNFFRFHFPLSISASAAMKRGQKARCPESG